MTPQAVADALVAAMNAAAGDAFAESFFAKRLYQPIYELQDMDVLHVSVIPGTLQESVFNRQNKEQIHGIDVAVQKKLSNPDDTAKLDALLALETAILDFVSDPERRELVADEAWWVGNKVKALWLPEHLKTLNTFTGIVTVSYKTYA